MTSLARIRRKPKALDVTMRLFIVYFVFSFILSLSTCHAFLSTVPGRLLTSPEVSSAKLTSLSASIHHKYLPAFTTTKYYRPHRVTPHHDKSLQLHMATPAASIKSMALAGAITGGFIGGALHAIAGPDHLAALLPRCVGQRWYRAGRIGALWAMGHGVSATILGLSAFFLKNRIQHITSIQVLHGATEIAVGASLILIGILGIREAKEWEEEMTNNNMLNQTPQSLSAAVADVGAKTEAQKRAVLFNGILHGFSWDGAPSLAPAVALATWRGSLTFLLAYALGTMGAMTLATTVIGEMTRRAGEIFHKPDLPQKLSLVSSFLAIAVGLFWCFLALKPSS